MAEYYQIFLSFSVLGGISSSTLFTPPIAAVCHWFNIRRGWATGVACTAGGLGGVIFPLIIFLQHLMLALLGLSELLLYSVQLYALLHASKSGPG
jgi:sugar phosphate permease